MQREARARCGRVPNTELPHTSDSLPGSSAERGVHSFIGVSLSLAPTPPFPGDQKVWLISLAQRPSPLTTWPVFLTGEPPPGTLQGPQQVTLLANAGVA